MSISSVCTSIQEWEYKNSSTGGAASASLTSDKIVGLMINKTGFWKKRVTIEHHYRTIGTNGTDFFELRSCNREILNSEKFESLIEYLELCGGKDEKNRLVILVDCISKKIFCNNSDLAKSAQTDDSLFGLNGYTVIFDESLDNEPLLMRARTILSNW